MDAGAAAFAAWYSNPEQAAFARSEPAGFAKENT